mgnify:FL=1
MVLMRSITPTVNYAKPKTDIPYSVYLGTLCSSSLDSSSGNCLIPSGATVVREFFSQDLNPIWKISTNHPYLHLGSEFATTHTRILIRL